jgi:hypothetical protein
MPLYGLSNAGTKTCTKLYISQQEMQYIHYV